MHGACCTPRLTAARLPHVCPTFGVALVRYNSERYSVISECVTATYGIEFNNRSPFQGKVLHTLFGRPSPRLRASVQAILGGLGHGPAGAQLDLFDQRQTAFVAVHLRTRPKEIETEGERLKDKVQRIVALRMLQCAEVAIRRIPGDRVVYFATDSPRFRPDFNSRLSKVGSVAIAGAADGAAAGGAPVSTRVVWMNTTDIGSSHLQLGRSDAAADRALAEWYIMSKASVLVKGRSSFSCTAALLGRGRGTLQQVYSYHMEMDWGSAEPHVSGHTVPGAELPAVNASLCQFEQPIDLDMACAA